MSKRDPFVMIEQAVRGWIGTLMVWSEKDEMFLPDSSSYWTAESYEEAIPLAQQWADEEGVELVN